ncbi:hypothetical protein [Metabacillus litoralis]|nr:hypothetical protein [Metabacillus litoralis]
MIIQEKGAIMQHELLGIKAEVILKLFHNRRDRGATQVEND